MASLGIGGCQTTGVELTRGEASKAYFGCVFGQYIVANPDGNKDKSAAIDAAISACDDQAYTYAKQLLDEQGVSPVDWGHNANLYVIPDLEKEARKQLSSALSSS